MVLNLAVATIPDANLQDCRQGRLRLFRLKARHSTCSFAALYQLARLSPAMNTLLCWTPLQLFK